MTEDTHPCSRTKRFYSGERKVHEGLRKSPTWRALRIDRKGKINEGAGPKRKPDDLYKG